MKLKEEKGLTLVELLATLVILAIIATIAVLSIGQIIKNSQEKAIIADGLRVIEATKLAEANGDKCKVERFPFKGFCTYTLDDLKPYLNIDDERIRINLGKDIMVKVVLDGKAIEADRFQNSDYIRGETYFLHTNSASVSKASKINMIRDTSKYYPGKSHGKVSGHFYEVQLKNALEGKGQENKKIPKNPGSVK